MKKRYISWLLVALCLLTVTGIGVSYAKYITKETKSAFTLSSDLEFETYTYAVLDTETNALSIRNREAIIKDGKLIDKDGAYTLGENGNVYALPFQQSTTIGQELDVRIAKGNTPEGAIEGAWTAKHTQAGAIEQVVTSVTFDDAVYLQGRLNELFQAWTKLTLVDLTKADFSEVTSTYKMFDSCYALTSIAFADTVDTGRVTTMSYMFYALTSLTSLDVSSFDTSAVEDMSFMFSGCSGLTKLDVTELDTSSVTNMTNIFANCRGLTQIDISDLDTQNVTNMDSMFSSCSGLMELDVSTIDTTKATNMRNMFAGCSKLTKLDITSWNTSNLTNTSQMFSGCSSLSDLKWDESFTTAGVTTMQGMFMNCTGFTSLDLTSFDTSSVKDMSQMFSGFKGTSLDISMFNTSSVTNMKEMFRGCNLATLDLSSFDTRKVTNMGLMFFQCTSLTDLDLSGFTTTSVLTNMRETFYRCTNLTSLDLSGFDTSSVKDMHRLFKGCGKLVTIYASEKFVTNNVTSGNEIFDGCSVLKGGNGTVWSVSDITYARIDGGTESPGYFTDKNASDTQTLEMDGLTNLTASCDPAEIVPGEAFTITLTPNAGYVLPDTVTVAIDGIEKTKADGVTYNPENGVITIPGELVTEGIAISVTAEAKQQISVTTVFASELTVACSPTVPIPGQAFIVTLTGEALPNGVTVTIDGTEATAAYDKTAGTITIPGELLASTTTSITITAAAPEAPTAGCDCTTQCTAENTKDDCPVCGTDVTLCQVKQAETTPICICDTKCTELNTNCPLCSADISTCNGKEQAAAPTCTCETKCADLNAACTICAVDVTDCTGTETLPPETNETETTPVCTCEVRCTALNDTCAVCSTDITTCVGTEQQPPANDPAVETVTPSETATSEPTPTETPAATPESTPAPVESETSANTEAPAPSPENTPAPAATEVPETSEPVTIPSEAALPPETTQPEETEPEGETE